ncbi:hypothetical protein DFH27DRAFT_615241 [Peziza echinospora]|nr:hypothetical protein DFH27DRAFT_615241 [Peziza echinospora]
MNIDNYGSSRGGGPDKYSSTRDYHVRPNATGAPAAKPALADQRPQNSDHRRDRDRAERGDRSGRGERSGRSDRDRGDRERGDRDRERGDRDRRGERGDRGDRDRRDRERHRERSLSPGGHRSSRTSRRDFEHEPAAPRTDRYREREQPDRFPRHMDVDREYERERAGRDRDRERSSRYDDARRDSVGAARKRSATPPVKKREPTPDLTDTVPIDERPRRLTMWDIKPQGYENVTAEQAKLSGMFPLPGAPRQTPLDPTRLQAFMAQGPTNSATVTALKPTNSRQAKRLILSSIPSHANEENLLSFLNSTLSNLNVVTNADPVTNVQFSANRTLGLIEFKSSEDTTVALAFSGIEYEGTPLELRRPKDYIVPLIADTHHREPVPPIPGQSLITPLVPDTPNKIAISNIPRYLSDEQVIELLKSFGELKAFILVKDNEQDESQGIAFCEYIDPSTTEIAVEGLNGMELGDKLLRVQLASVGMKQAPGVELGVNAMAMMAGTTSTELEQGRVLQLLNMVTTDELMDPEEYEEIKEDIRDECKKFGAVVDMNIPRPTGGSRQSAGLGKIYVRFESPESATKALRALAGRKFADRTVVCTYFSEENYEVGAF